MNLRAAKNRRFYAIILLAALALLQVRLAFGACEMGASSRVAAAACCDEAEADGGMGVRVDVTGITCPAAACADQVVAPQADASVLLSAQIPSFAPAPPPFPHYRPSSDALLRIAAADGHPPHTPLIYVLQRLLI